MPEGRPVLPGHPPVRSMRTARPAQTRTTADSMPAAVQKVPPVRDVQDFPPFFAPLPREASPPSSAR